MGTNVINAVGSEEVSNCQIIESARPIEVCGTGRLEQTRSIGILLIEDDRMLLKSMAKGLRERGFVVWAVSDGGKAIDAYRLYQAQIDIVLSDVQMPVLDGPKTLDVLRKLDPSVRFCFMTGNTGVANLANLQRRGVLRIFTKPFPSLAAVIDELWELAARPQEQFVDRDVLVEDAGIATSETALVESGARSENGSPFRRFLASLIR